MERQPNTEYVLSISYGKDSIACLEAIHQLGLPLDRIVHAEVWATDTIPADLPPMVEFKKFADQVIKFRYGIDVEHIHAVDKNGEKLTYEKMFYHKPVRKAKPGGGFSDSLKSEEYGATADSNYLPYKGFPLTRGSWCKKLKTTYAVWQHLRISNIVPTGGGIGVPQSRREFSALPHSQGAITNTVSYLGIAADEPLRIEKHKDKAIMPLTIIGWDEAYCRQWCEENLLLAPTYSDSLRGGCWFCHNQSVGQLRLLRKKYPEYWQLLLKWDNDSPVTFKPDGHTVHDFEKRFAAEDSGLIVPGDSRFRWKQIL